MDSEIRIVSPDDHVVEPPRLWTDRLPQRYHDKAPHVVRARGRIGKDHEFQYDDDGVDADVWVYDGMINATAMTVATVGFKVSDIEEKPMTFDGMRPGCYDPKARIEDMEVSGVEASACFPNTFVRFCGQRFLIAPDKELAKLCVEAYNDWMIDEWCGASGGRLIELGIIPLWDPQLAAREVERTAARGMKAYCFSELPAELGLPSIHSGEWDPFFAACQDTDTAIMMHIGSSSTIPRPSPDSPHVVTSSLMAVNSAMAMMDWLFSGILLRFPRLRVGFGECQAGWIPYFLQRADEVWEMRRSWGSINPLLTEPPSSQIPGRVWYSFFDDEVAMHNLDLLGTDQIMFETDYPHNDTNWPVSLEVAHKQTQHLDAATREKVLRGNARRLFKLD